MQLATHGQWWSNLATQWLQTAQCFDLSGLLTKHAEQNDEGSKPPGPVSANSIIVCERKLVLKINMRIIN